MKTSTYEKWFEDEIWRRKHIAPEHLKSHLDHQHNNNLKRKELLEKFPYLMVLEGFYPEYDKIIFLLWNRIGPSDGECHQHHSEFPACHKVLDTQVKVRKFYKDKEGKELSYETDEYSKLAEHSHEGIWDTFWLGKTGYDFGFMEFYFQKKEHMDLFTGLIPLVTPDPEELTDEVVDALIVQALRTPSVEEPIENTDLGGKAGQT